MGIFCRTLTGGQPRPLCASSWTDSGPALQGKALHPRHCPRSPPRPAEVREARTNQKQESEKQERREGDFPGGPVAKNLPAGVGDTG